MGTRATCISCGRHYSLDKAKSLGDTPEERYKTAFDFSRMNGTDLAGAYSVLLGIMPLEDAVQVSNENVHNPGLKNTVAKRNLTVREATERGDRVAYATRIAHKHGLPMQVALLVADNQMRLVDALAAKNAPVPEPTAEQPRSPWPRRLVQSGVVVVVGSALFAMFRSEPASPESTIARPVIALQAIKELPATASSAEEPKIASVVFQTDEHGRVLKATGPDPKSVLLALCAHAQFAPVISAIALAPAVPPDAGLRLGIAREWKDPSIELCFSIWLDPRTGQWFAGDGNSPIVGRPAPRIPPGTVPISVAESL